MIGQELRKARKRAGFTQEELAQKAMLHPTYIGLLERNKRSPSLEVFLRLCVAMNISPGALLDRITQSKKKKGG
jgi:XRE family transcriptional regulator, regulator of sulfur utilization